MKKEGILYGVSVILVVMPTLFFLHRPCSACRSGPECECEGEVTNNCK